MIPPNTSNPTQPPNQKQSMKTKTRISILTVLAATATLAFPQGGPLAPPPGAPAPTMKTLDEVEPRIPLIEGAPGVAIAPTGNITLSEPGSYYLTRNVEHDASGHAILINADGVTLDLMGHQIIYTGAGNTGSAIEIDGANITIKNGHIISTSTHDGSSFSLGGFQYGVNASELSHTNVILRNLTVRGIRSWGIRIMGQASLVENCSVFIAGQYGIQASNGAVRGCVAWRTGSYGIAAGVVTDSRTSNTDSVGIGGGVISNSNAQSAMGAAISGTVVKNCYGQSTGSHGIIAVSSVSGSYGWSTASGTSWHGIFCSGGTVINSRGNAAGGHGISANNLSSSRGETSGEAGLGSNGIIAARIDHSTGVSTNSTSGGTGIFASQLVVGSSGSSGFALGNGGGNGIQAQIVAHSYGGAATGANHGISARIVESSYGSRDTPVSGKFGLEANRASLSEGLNGESITHRYNMP